MPTKRPKRRIERRPLKSLKPHPAQAKLFDDLDDAELQRLADDMKEHGQLVPVEILPNGTVICGHQRVRAAKQLGWTHIRCWVREDLDADGQNAVELRLIEDNQNRRQLSKLSVARLALRLFEIEKGRSVKDIDYWECDEARDRVGVATGMSGRSLTRYWNVLRSPLAVQRAFERGELPLVQADKVSRLPADEQAEISATINAGVAPKEAVKKFVSANGKAKTLGAQYRRFMKAIRDAEGLMKNIGKVKFAPDPGAVKLLREVARKLEPLAEILERNERRHAQRNKEFFDDLYADR